MKKITVAVHYEITSPESSEQGDFEEVGTEIERRRYEKGDLRDFKRKFGGFYSLENSGSDWFQSYSSTNYRDGFETCYTIHFIGVTKASIKRIDRVLSTRL